MTKSPKRIPKSSINILRDSFILACQITIIFPRRRECQKWLFAWWAGLGKHLPGKRLTRIATLSWASWSPSSETNCRIERGFVDIQQSESSIFILIVVNKDDSTETEQMKFPEMISNEFLWKMFGAPRVVVCWWLCGGCEVCFVLWQICDASRD